jgi:hypothetical protein
MLLLFGVGCSKTARPPFLPPHEPVPPPEMLWDVRTDFSALTPFVPHTKHTRLHDGPLTQLLPSNDYGMLLPYASAITMQDGSLRETRFGFVTIDGVIITDLIYTSIQRAAGYNVYPSAPWAAYMLSENVPGTETEWGFTQRQAACALDGSWVTPFEYVDISFAEDVIFLTRYTDSFDIDVYDYSGQFLYNILELEWISDIMEDVWQGWLYLSTSEGYGLAQMNDGTYAVFDVKTGNIRRTQFIGMQSFSEGLAAVQIASRQGGMELWGVANKDLEIVIPPRFLYPPWFNNGRAVVDMPGDTRHVIDERGEILFSISDEYYIQQSFDGSSFIIYSRDSIWPARILTNDLYEYEITMSQEAHFLLNEHYIRELGNGWFASDTTGGLFLFTRDAEYYIPMNTDATVSVNEIIGEYIVYMGRESITDWTPNFGIITIDGRTIVPPERDITITAVTEEGTAKAFIINSSVFGFFVRAEYSPSTYRLVDTDGNIIASGTGTMSYDESLRLYSILGANHFTWLDAQGNVIISIPSMSSTFD